MFGFEHVAGFLIGYDGSWHLKATAGNAFSNPKWPDVWSGKFENYAGMGRMAIELKENEMKNRASKLAESMLKAKYWELSSNIRAS